MRLETKLHMDRLEAKQASLDRERANMQANERGNAEQDAKNQEVDELISRLMQCDEKLASLLTQAADSFSALLPQPDPSTQEVGKGKVLTPATGAKAFELRAQEWFATLHDIQVMLRSAVRHLRDSSVPPITPVAGGAGKSNFEMGSAARGDNLRSLSAFLDITPEIGVSNRDEPAKALAQGGWIEPDDKDRTSSSHASTTPAPKPDQEDAELSLSALRQQYKAWSDISRALEGIVAEASTSSARDGSKDSSSTVRAERQQSPSQGESRSESKGKASASHGSSSQETKHRVPSSPSSKQSAKEAASKRTSAHSPWSIPSSKGREDPFKPNDRGLLEALMSGQGAFRWDNTGKLQATGSRSL